MKVIVILTAMLWYEGIGMSAQTDFTRVQFKSITECQDYVFKNKVMLIDELFEMHRVVDDKVLKLHLIPSGILYKNTTCLIGSGTVVDPKILLKEIDMLIDNGIDISGLKISSTSHVTMPYHRILDEAMEADLSLIHI